MKGEKGKQKKKNTKMSIIVGVLVLSLIGVSVIAFYPWSTMFPPEEDVPASIALTRSTFTLIDYRTGEDVSAWVEISVFTPDEDDLPFDADDAQTLTNFDEEVSSADADTVSIDLRSHATAWIEIDPDFESDYASYNGVYNPIVSRDFRKIFGGTNYNYNVYVYHIPSNVSVEMASRGAMDAIDGQADDLPALGDGRAYNNTCNTVGTYARATDGTYTVSLNLPYESTDGYHAGDTGGDEWDMDADELAAIVADAAIHSYDIDYELLWLQDQKNHRTIAPLYDLTVDTNKDFLSVIEQVSNCLTVRITMNTTISATDGNAAQVNVTVMTRDGIDIPAEVVIHTTFIDFIFYEPIVCYDNKYNFDIRLEFGINLFVSSVTTNRIVTPSDRNNLGAVTLLNTMLLEVLTLD